MPASTLLLIGEVLATLILVLTIAFWGYGLYGLRKSLSTLRKPNPNITHTPKFSVVIPCRNCVDTIVTTIKSIATQNIKPLKVVVVDDGSTDGSAEAVRALASELASQGLEVSVVSVNNVPPGWVPKPYACLRGYLEVRDESEVIVFLDSDTWFTREDSLRALVGEAWVTGLASYAPRFVCGTRACRAAEVLLTTFSHAFLGFDKVFDPKSRIAWFFGCCWAVRRDVYEALGTHESVKNEVVEDKALAIVAKRRGVSFAVLAGFDRVASLWHPRLSDSVNVLARIFWRRITRERGRSLAYATLFLLPYLVPALGPASLISMNPFLIAAGYTAYAVCTLTHVTGSKLNGYSVAYAFAAPYVGVALICMFMSRILKGEFEWRGRRANELLGNIHTCSA